MYKQRDSHLQTNQTSLNYSPSKTFLISSHMSFFHSLSGLSFKKLIKDREKVVSKLSSSAWNVSWSLLELRKWQMSKTLTLLEPPTSSRIVERSTEREVRTLRVMRNCCSTQHQTNCWNLTHFRPLKPVIKNVVRSPFTLPLE